MEKSEFDVLINELSGRKEFLGALDGDKALVTSIKNSMYYTSTLYLLDEEELEMLRDYSEERVAEINEIIEPLITG